MNIGVDIVEIERIKQALVKSIRFKERVFTKHEISYCESRGQQSYASFAGIYAAKEAFVKALGTGFRKGSWQDIEVIHTEEGAPRCICKGVFGEIFLHQGYENIAISISHSKAYAVGQILLYGSKNKM